MQTPLTKINGVPVQIFTNVIAFPFGLTLFVGRKKTVINTPTQLEWKRELPVLVVEELKEPLYISPVPIRETYSLRIDGKLFSVTRPTGTKRFSVKLSRRNTDGTAEIRLVKKHTVIRESVRKSLQWN